MSALREQPQLNLFTLGVTPVLDCSKMSADEFFVRFNQRNPHIYQLLVRLAREFVRKTGRDRMGIRLAWERLRWDLAVHASSEDAYRLNNILTPFYARLIMAQEPDLSTLFAIRERSAA